MSKIHSPRKGSLGFSFKRIRNRTVAGGYKKYLWFHKVGMGHNKDSTRYESNTYLQLIPTKILGYKHKSNKNLLTMDQIKERAIPLTEIRTILSLKPKFRKSRLLKETGYIESVDQIYNLMNIPEAKLKVTSATKGKGYSGVVKTRGIKIGKRKHSRSNTTRHVGSIGGRTGHVDWRAPMCGNMGNAKRTYVVYVSNNLEKNADLVNTAKFKYGYIENKYIVLRGSIPGNIKQIVRLCYYTK